MLANGLFLVPTVQFGQFEDQLVVNWVLDGVLLDKLRIVILENLHLALDELVKGKLLFLSLCHSTLVLGAVRLFSVKFQLGLLRLISLATLLRNIEGSLNQLFDSFLLVVELRISFPPLKLRFYLSSQLLLVLLAHLLDRV